MNGAYRAATNTCPSCGAPLREFAKRLVCEACGGMLIGISDFVSACTELTGDLDEPTYRDDVRSDAACPRCAGELIACRLTVGKRKLRPLVLRCERDGLWCPPDTLTEMFAVLGRAAHRLSAGNSLPTSGRTEGTPFPLHTTSAGILRIGHRRTRRERRTPVPAVDVYREHPLPCPACTDKDLVFAGDRWVCASCTGVFVQREPLVALIEEMSNAPYELPDPIAATGTRACPVCRAQMLVEEVGAAKIERCIEHGLWFDAEELQHALATVTAPERTGLVGWIGRLFS